MKKHIILFAISMLITSIMFMLAGAFDASATEACPPGYWFKDEQAPWEFTAKPVYEIYQVCIKAGTQCFIYNFDQTNGCYIVTGLGTNHVVVTGGGTGQDCQTISHVAFYKMAITQTPTQPSTATFTPTFTNTPTNTATNTPTTEITFTPTVTNTGTILPSLTPTWTLTPTMTLTPTWTTTPGLFTPTVTLTPITPLPPRTPWKTPHKDTELPKTGAFEDIVGTGLLSLLCISAIVIVRVVRKRQ